jgi:TPR repeat protein
MKTITMILLLLITTLTLSAKTTNLYTHARDVRLASSRYKNVKNSYKKLFFAKRAAKRGNPKAQFDLAIMYASGDGVKKDERLAFNWFHKSARGGNRDAKYYMGVSFLQGRGVKKNIHLARYWFKLAAKAGHQKAIYNLAKVEKFLFGSTKSGNYYSRR